jgi:hypothetical protein
VLRPGAVALRRCKLTAPGSPARLRLKLRVSDAGRVSSNKIFAARGWDPAVLACVKAWGGGLRFTPPVGGEAELEVVVILPLGTMAAGASD